LNGCVVVVGIGAGATGARGRWVLGGPSLIPVGPSWDGGNRRRHGRFVSIGVGNFDASVPVVDLVVFGGSRDSPKRGSGALFRSGVATRAGADRVARS